METLPPTDLLTVALRELGNASQEEATITSNLFHIERKVELIAPPSIEAAMIIATAILRSNVYKAKLMALYTNSMTNHFHMKGAELQAVLARSGLFRIDKIRIITYMNARACTLREFDPWKIYLHPLLLLEMKDQEEEYGEISGGSSGFDQIAKLAPFDKQGNPSRRQFNSLLYMNQKAALLASENVSNPYQRKATSSSKSPKTSVVSLSVIPSNLNLIENHVLMLTILLIHEASHLINYALSSNFDHQTNTGGTPEKIFNTERFNDIGHMMELVLFGMAISHGVDNHFPTLFGVKHIIGASKQRSDTGFVPQPSPAFREMIQNAITTKSCNPNAITAEMLVLEKTSGALYKPEEKFKFSGKASFPDDGRDLDGLFESESKIEGESEEEGPMKEGTKEDFEGAYTLNILSHSKE